MFNEMIKILCFDEDGMFFTRNEIMGKPLTKEFVLHWTCRDENLIKYITEEYFQPLSEKATLMGGDDDSYSGVRCKIHIHRTGPAGMKTINENSLWKSFRDKTERGVTGIESGLLGTFGTPWSPYRFSFGRWDTLWQQIPSILMFCLIMWLSYVFSLKVSFWLSYNPFDLPGALNDFVRILDFIPTLFISFSLGWIGHILMDWTENIYARKFTSFRVGQGKIVDDNMDDVGMDRGFAKSAIRPEGKADKVETVPSSGSLLDFKMISLDSTAGRPQFDELVDASEANGYQSTGIYLCGPEKMVESCKKAAGVGCQVGAERLQMLAKGNKFVFYEEKFAW